MQRDAREMKILVGILDVAANARKVVVCKGSRIM